MLLRVGPRQVPLESLTLLNYLHRIVNQHLVVQGCRKHLNDQTSFFLNLPLCKKLHWKEDACSTYRVGLTGDKDKQQRYVWEGVRGRLSPGKSAYRFYGLVGTGLAFLANSLIFCFTDRCAHQRSSAWKAWSRDHPANKCWPFLSSCGCQQKLCWVGG